MLTVEDLRTDYFTAGHAVPAVRGIDLHIASGTATAAASVGVKMPP